MTLPLSANIGCDTEFILGERSFIHVMNDTSPTTDRLGNPIPTLQRIQCTSNKKAPTR